MLDPTRHETEDDVTRTSVRAADPRNARRTGWLTATALVVVTLVYLPHLGKGFVSEDFLLVALHRENPPWRDLSATFGEPWLGMRLFEFYRPVAVLLFGLESVLFGASSLPYNAVHLAVHLFATWIVSRILVRLLAGPGSEADASLVAPAVFCGTLLFGLYPLAPNSVLFAASFANLFGAAATLAATLLYLRWHDGVQSAFGLPTRVPSAALAVYALAIGCYESSIVLPLWLGLLALTQVPPHRSRSSSLVALAPFVVLTLAYLGFRASLFGEPLGGYGEVAGRLRTLDPAMAALALRGLLRLPAPWFEAAPNQSLEVIGCLVAAGAAVVFLASARRARPLLRLFLLGAAWMLLFQAPFSFQLVSPANGRYWYLASAGAAMALAALLARAVVATSARARRFQIALAAIVVLALLTRNTVQLQRHLGWMGEASRTAERIATAISSVASVEPIFVADHPDFLRSDRGVNRAQIYHYGLRAALGRPFRDRQIEVYPLPSRDVADPRRLAARYPVFRWVPSEQRLQRLAPRVAALPPLLEVEGPSEGATVSPEDERTSRVSVVGSLPARTTSARVVWVAPGNATVSTPTLAPPAGNLELPAAFVRMWADLAPGPQFWWVETRDERGRTTGSSEPRWLEVATAP